jgi:Mor family transcriptional regulator
MLGNGDKVTWIVDVLADKYKVSERKIYNIVRHFKKDCTSHTV